MSGSCPITVSYREYRPLECRMKFITVFLLLLPWLLPASAPAEVRDASPAGFTLEHEAVIAADRLTVWRAAVHGIGDWWSDAHTISGDATKLSIDPRPQGCFCETLGGGAGMVHQTVTFVNPTVMLRLTGGLGPLGLMGVSGNMLWEFFDDPAGTRVRFSYAVGGYHPEGLDALAAAVDSVIGDALVRLARFVEVDGEERGRDD